MKKKISLIPVLSESKLQDLSKKIQHVIIKGSKFFFSKSKCDPRKDFFNLDKESVLTEAKNIAPIGTKEILVPIKHDQYIIRARLAEVLSQIPEQLEDQDICGFSFYSSKSKIEGNFHKISVLLYTAKPVA